VVSAGPRSARGPCLAVRAPDRARPGKGRGGGRGGACSAHRDLSSSQVALSRALENTQAAFRFQVEQLAEEARCEILPYFKKHNYAYTAGNGSWFISKPAADDADYYKPDNYVEDDDLPQNIRELLWLEVAHGDHLGFYVRDIKRGEW
jgi:hypothetical protein